PSWSRRSSPPSAAGPGPPRRTPPGDRAWVRSRPRRCRPSTSRALPYLPCPVDVNGTEKYDDRPMKFTKMHGAGNDYVYVDAFKEKIADPSALSIAISDRHTGIGSDGLILIAPSKKADFRMIMFNADGSEGEMCGNGIRCIGKYVYDHGLTKKKSISVETKGGTVELELHAKGGRAEEVTADRGAARPVPKPSPAGAGGEKPLLAESVDGFQG